MRTRQPTRCCCTTATSFVQRGKNLSKSKRGHVSIDTKQLLPQVRARLCAPSQPQTTLLARAEALDRLSAWKDNGSKVSCASSGIFAAKAVGTASFCIGSGVEKNKIVVATAELPALVRMPRADAIASESASDLVAGCQR